ncbi:MAG: hypothetical protein M0Z28_02295 [Rhodospirillales bacterium]|nr:hypothetical protein [Rhodospirillales bacterium]
MRKAMRLLAELVGVFVCGVIGFFVGLILAAGAVLAWLLGCASALFLLVALAESAWWMHTHSHHAAVTALGYYAYTAGAIGLISVLFWLKDRLVGWPNVGRGRVVRHRMSLTPDEAFEVTAAPQSSL